jgi:hypothetical protein
MKQAAPKPRDPFVRHIIARKQGAHGKSRKAERRAFKASIRSIE